MGGRFERGYLTQLEFKEACMKLGIRGDRNTMDRLYLFFRRYNLMGDDRLCLQDLAVAICPMHPHLGNILRNRPHSMMGHFTQREVFDYFTIEKLTAVIDLAIETEV